MGNNRLFWPQETMDQWVIDEKAGIQNDVLSIVGEDIKYKLVQAVHFTADVGDGTDPHNWVGRVKELETLIELGAEHYMDSVIYGDSAYQVVPGFTGEPVVEVSGEGKDGGEDITGAVKTQAGEGEESEDRELLAEFLLNNL